MKYLTRICLIGILTILISSCQTKSEVDLIVHNARIYTVDSSFSIKEAVAIKDGEFLLVGTDEEVLGRYRSNKVLDVEGGAIYPGFYDAHCHFFSLAEGIHQVNLIDVGSLEELIDRVKDFRVKYPNEQWITGHGWDQNKWTDKQFPDNRILSEVFTDVPVYLRRIDGHAALANKKALELAGVDVHSQPIGGSIIQKNGEVTGVLIDNAMDLVQQKIPRPDTQHMSNMLMEAEKACLAVGLTTLADAGLSIEQIDLLKKLYDEKKLTIREYAMIMLDPKSLSEILERGIYTSNELDVRSFKIVADGALGSRGACLLHPYSDAHTSGFLLQTPKTLDSVIAKVAESDFQLNIHAIGDSTNRFILDSYMKHLNNKSNKRWRIEHAQIIAPADFQKFSMVGIVPSIQPTHATSDMNWAISRLGSERIKGAYAYKQLLQQAGRVAIGSDFPVEDINPIYQFHAAVARTDKENNPSGGFQMDNALTREEALKGLTIWPAYACFQEDKKGSIEKGKLADFVLLERDIMQVDTKELRATKVNKTWIGGKEMFSRN